MKEFKGSKEERLMKKRQELLDHEYDHQFQRSQKQKLQEQIKEKKKEYLDLKKKNEKFKLDEIIK